MKTGWRGLGCQLVASRRNYGWWWRTTGVGTEIAEGLIEDGLDFSLSELE
jgi:hypothetical protein